MSLPTTDHSIASTIVIVLHGLLHVVTSNAVHTDVTLILKRIAVVMMSSVVLTKTIDNAVLENVFLQKKNAHVNQI